MAVAFLWLLICPAAMAGMDTVSALHVKVGLVAEQNAVVPQRAPGNWVGFYFQLDPGWHIYWVNSGDSGAPPQVNWQLPPGFSAGPLQWPSPERFPTLSLMDYGYQDSVLLMAPLHVPPQLRVASVPIAADLRWLVCRDMCIAGRAQLQMTLPVAASAGPNPATHPLFETARSLLPKPMPPGWTLSAHSRKDAFLVHLRTGKAEHGVYFFPLVPGQIEDSAPQAVQYSAASTSLQLKKSGQLMHEISTLTGVLRVSGNAYSISVPVRR
jgi:thiol:disulfide interchange protein DsbD